VRSGRVERRDEATADGLKCTGTVRYARTDGTPAYTLHVGFDVDARERWADVRSRFVAESDLDVRSVEGLRLHVVNDRFNRGRRTWAWDRGRLAMAFDLRGPWPERETIRSTPFDGRWVNIDNRVGVIAIALAAGGFTLRTSDRRNGPWGSIHYDVLDCPRMSETPRRFRRGDIVLETAFRVVAGSVGRTREVAARTR
jgi:hypothetical protein